MQNAKLSHLVELIHLLIKSITHCQKDISNLHEYLMSSNLRLYLMNVVMQTFTYVVAPTRDVFI